MHQQNLVFGGYSRLTRDAAELLTADFTCSASSVLVTQTSESLNEPGSIALEIKVFEGAYRGGRFYFCFQIPANYPFKSVEVWAVNPIWHPNVDIRSGRMSIPLEWSPVLTLKTFARTVQMLMIEPSAEVPLNVNALSLFSNSPAIFDRRAQQSLRGGWFEGVFFHTCCTTTSHHTLAEPIEPLTRRKRKLSISDSYVEFDDFDENSNSQICRKRTTAIEAEGCDSDNDDNDDDEMDVYPPNAYSTDCRVSSNGSIFLREEAGPGPQYRISKLSLRGNDDEIAVHDENSLLRSPIVSGSPQQRKYRKIGPSSEIIGSPMIISSSQQSAMMVEDIL